MAGILVLLLHIPLIRITQVFAFPPFTEDPWVKGPSPIFRPRPHAACADAYRRCRRIFHEPLVSGYRWCRV
ncbi:hypothetical protein B0H11DRAFT_1976765 [Mycena galericulata]|nr:hypothetical protein B0H11DRAFT_1976765 [Mycena galericulata]